MLMIPSKLIGLFLGLYISGVSATPTAVTPNTPALLPRDNLCHSDIWLRSECHRAFGLKAWLDDCSTPVSGEILQIGAECPGNTYCENINDGQVQSSKCVNRQAPGTSAARNTPKDPIIGSSGNFMALRGLANSQFQFTVRIEDEMKASVAAFILSKDGEFAMTPNNILVGKISGKEITVCKGDTTSIPSRATECYPTGRYQLWKGDHIDFTWGMTRLQIGSLAYTIWPSD